MSDPAKIAAAIRAGPLPSEPFAVALPMYDWPEVRAETDAQWAAIRYELRMKGVNAPERLARRNADLPPVPGGIKDGFGKVIAPDPASLPPDKFDLAVLWQHPNLLLSQTCWGPLELWLRGVRVVGQEDYSGIEGGEGEMYSSAIVMRRRLPPSAAHGRGSSPTRGEVGRPIPPLAGETPAKRAEGGRLSAASLAGLRLAYNAPDSMSGILVLQRGLEAQDSGLHIFRETVETGGHRASIRSIAEGRADVAAVDAKTWGLAQRFEPAALELALVGWTGKRKGLPFVTAAR